MTSLWLDRAQNPAAGRCGVEVPNSEVIVVGAGITGLVTAVLLARGGKRVVVIEARFPGACTTGNTTAKISLLQGTRLSAVARRRSPGLLAGYVEGNREGQAWLTHYCAEKGIAVQREDAITYAQGQPGLPLVRAELAAATTAGLPAEWIDTLGDYAGLDVPFCGGVRLGGQAQFNPMPLLDALIAELAERGGRLVTGRRVRKASVTGGRVRLELGGGDSDGRDIAAADQCVLATGIPVLDRGGYFARLEPVRSYCVALRMPTRPPRPMMLSADSPARSLRYAVTNDGTEQLIVGGGGHIVGRKHHSSASYDELITWATRYFPGAEPTHSWSAQDYAPVGGLPYVGPLLPGSDRFFVATGFAKWGMTNGVAAALLLSKRILGGEPGEWASAFDSWNPHELTGISRAVKLNLEVGWYLATGWAVNTVRSPGHPVCTHLGGVLSWNDAEKSWDCPLHGSRFSPCGAVLEGPATRDLVL